MVCMAQKHLSHDMTKPTKWLCAQRRLRSAWVSAQSDQSSLCAHWVAKGPKFLHADSVDSDQTGRMPRLIWVFAGRTLTLLVLSCRGSCLIPVSSIWVTLDIYTIYNTDAVIYSVIRKKKNIYILISLMPWKCAALNLLFFYFEETLYMAPTDFSCT